MTFDEFIKDYNEIELVANMPSTVEEWLGEDNVSGCDIWRRKYQYKNETFPEWVFRVSGGKRNVAALIVRKRFLFGGRVLSNRGTDDNTSMFNCHFLRRIEDDYGDIMKALTQVGTTLKGQGGQGIDLSDLRPKGSPVGERYQSDGIIPFMHMFNAVTEGTANGGSRRGALMMELNANHKDAMDFITCKQDTDKVNGANLSLILDDEFMQAVSEYYRTGEAIVLHKKKNYSGHEVEWDVTPIEVFKALAYNAWDNGEPGCLFDTSTQNYNMMETIPTYGPLGHNPCSEQILPPHGSCNLGSLNIASFIVNPYTKDAGLNVIALRYAAKIAVEALDDIIDENADRFPLTEQKEMSQKYRNIGVGFYGLGTAMMMMGLRYGTEEAAQFAERVVYNILISAFEKSVELSKQKGPFPGFEPKMLESSFIVKNIPSNLIEEARVHGLRNCSLLTVPPTGSLSFMQKVTSAAEPEFAIVYGRKVIGDAENEDKVYKVYCQAASDYMKIYNTDVLPDYFVGSSDIHWKDRVDLQARIQKYIDTGISSTVNLPKEATVEDVEQIYLKAWESGCKGITVFRDGCARAGVLTTTKQDDTEENKQDEQEELAPLKRGDIIQHNDDNIIKIRSLQSGCGKVYVHAHFDPDTGNLIEVFLDRGGSGGCERYMNGLSRMMSLAARGGIGTPEIIDQLMSVSQCAAYISRRVKFGDASKGTCCPGAIGYALKEMWEEVKDELFDDDEKDEVPRIVLGVPAQGSHPVNPLAESLKQAVAYKQGDKTAARSTTRVMPGFAKCPECGDTALTNESGCNVCKACGYSRCG